MQHRAETPRQGLEYLQFSWPPHSHFHWPALLPPWERAWYRIHRSPLFRRRTPRLQLSGPICHSWTPLSLGGGWEIEHERPAGCVGMESPRAPASAGRGRARDPESSLHEHQAQYAMTLGLTTGSGGRLTQMESRSPVRAGSSLHPEMWPEGGVSPRPQAWIPATATPRANELQQNMVSDTRFPLG